jgi:hypothetical protein
VTNPDERRVNRRRHRAQCLQRRYGVLAIDDQRLRTGHLHFDVRRKALRGDVEQGGRAVSLSGLPIGEGLLIQAGTKQVADVLRIAASSPNAARVTVDDLAAMLSRLEECDQADEADCG